MTDDVADLQHAMLVMHGVHGKHIGRIPVTEMFGGRVLSEVAVEVFDIAGHPAATRCYAWRSPAATPAAQAKIVCVLKLPPVDSPEAAVRNAMGLSTRGA